MTTEEITTLDEFKDPNAGEQWIEITLEVDELVSPFEADWVPSGEKAAQAGFLRDADGAALPFVNWKNSNQPEVEEGDTYEFSSLFMVYGQNNDGFTLIFRSDTSLTAVDGFPGGLKGGCPYCGEDLTDEHRGEGPEHPEVGWEYYECPGCGEAIRPELV